MHPSIVNARHVLRIKTPDSQWIYHSFDSTQAINEWHALMRIMSPFDPDHVERRLHLEFLDIGEMEPILKGDIDNHGSLASAAESSRTVRSHGVKSGWVYRGQLAIDV